MIGSRNVWVGAVVLAGALCGTAVAAPSSPASGATTAAAGGPATLQEVVAALEKAAGELYPAPQPRPLALVRTKVYERYGDGVRYETWSVTEGTQLLGDVMRVQVFKDPTTTIDLAARVTDGRIVGISPIKPVVLGGKPFPDTAPLFASLKERTVSSYAGGMSDVFTGLAHLDVGAAGPPPPPPPPAPGTPPVVTVTQAALPVGAALPAFSATTIGGKPVSSASFAGKVAVILVGDVTAGRSRDMLEVAIGELRGTAGVQLLTVLANDKAALGILAGTDQKSEVWLPDAVLDADRKIRQALMVNVVPQVFLFDKKSKLVDRLFFTGPEDLRRAVAAVVAASK